MENKAKKYARKIIEDYTRGEFDQEVVDAVKHWLGDGDNVREIEEALAEYWGKLGYKENRQTYEALMEIRRKLGMPEYLTGSRHKSDKDADPAVVWYRDMGDAVVNPGAKYYETADKTIELRRNVMYRTKPLRRIALRAAAIAIPLLIAVGTFIWYNTRHDAGKTEVLMSFTTAEGENKRLFLPDGTEVMMNEYSRLEYLGDRHAGLSGEAYFKVVSDTANPFFVNTGKMEVKVTGTEFNVEAYPARMQTDLDLYKGTVEVTLANNSYRMKPGTRISYDHVKDEVSTGNIRDTGKPKWVTEKLALRGKTLPEIFAMLEWYYNVGIELPANIDSVSIYVFELGGEEDLDKALGMLQSVSGLFDYEITGDEVIIKAVK